MRRTLLTASILSLALALTACGGDAQDEAAPEASTSASTSAMPSAEATPTAEDSPCARLTSGQLTKLAKAFGQKSAYGRVDLGASMSVPPMETCSFTLGSKTAGSSLTLGWSVEADPAAITSLRDYQKKTNGRYAELIDLKVPGVDQAFMVSRTGYGQVGDRAISAFYSGATQVSPAQMKQALQVLGQVSKDLPVWEPVVNTAACDGVEAEVAKVLGGEATIVRGTTDSEGTPTCRWSTGENGISVSKIRIADAAQVLQQDRELFGGKPVPGLGQQAVFIGGVDGTLIKVLVGKDEIVQFASLALMKVDRAYLEALARKLLPAF